MRRREISKLQQAEDDGDHEQEHGDGVGVAHAAEVEGLQVDVGAEHLRRVAPGRLAW